MIVASFRDVDFSDIKLPIFTICKHPRDFPDKFTVRVHSEKGPTNCVLLADTLEEARDALPPLLVCVGRNEGDDPVIVESWL